MAPSMTMRKRALSKVGSVKTVKRSIQILNLLAQSGGQVGVIEVAARLGASQSTVHRIVSTLVAEGYVAQNAQTGKYELGLSVLTLGGAVLNQLELRKQAITVLTRLAEETQCNANLAVFYRGEVLYVARADGPRSGLMYTPLGRRAPLHATALGKALLASMPDAEVEAVLAVRPLRACTHNTITDLKQLKDDVALARARGFALDTEEFIHGIRCVGVPIRGEGGAVAGALSVSGSAFQVRDETIERYGTLLQAAAYEISGRLGYVL